MSTRALVAGASARAAAKLRKPECREVLSDFRDAGGRRLSSEEITRQVVKRCGP
jgi:hypothetical protein